MSKKYLFLVVTFLITCLNTPLIFAGNESATNILIFVSFSMSKESLRGWLSEANQIKAPVIIRGLIHNSFKDTTKAVMEILQNQQGGVQLNPVLFKKYNIKKVPAVVVSSDNDFDIIYGDVTLDYALKEIAKQNDSLSPYAIAALHQLEKKNK